MSGTPDQMRAALLECDQAQQALDNAFAVDDTAQQQVTSTGAALTQAQKASADAVASQQATSAAVDAGLADVIVKLQALQQLRGSGAPTSLPNQPAA